ncbi:MAG TPA: hypothetical protein PK771_07585, partial [Spirochaetota bacterium]|nr:hypothetical protein [Spirochaetota bacterium]
MKSNIEMFFDAIQKNDFKTITNDWVYILSDLFHRAVLSYDDFLIFKDFYDRMGDMPFDKGIIKTDFFDRKKNNLFHGSDIQSFS